MPWSPLKHKKTMFNFKRSQAKIFKQGWVVKGESFNHRQNTGGEQVKCVRTMKQFILESVFCNRIHLERCVCWKKYKGGTLQFPIWFYLRSGHVRANAAECWGHAWWLLLKKDILLVFVNSQGCWNLMLIPSVNFAIMFSMFRFQKLISFTPDFW